MNDPPAQCEVVDRHLDSPDHVGIHHGNIVPGCTDFFDGNGLASVKGKAWTLRFYVRAGRIVGDLHSQLMNLNLRFIERHLFSPKQYWFRHVLVGGIRSLS